MLFLVLFKFYWSLYKIVSDKFLFFVSKMKVSKLLFQRTNFLVSKIKAIKLLLCIEQWKVIHISFKQVNES